MNTEYEDWLLRVLDTFDAAENRQRAQRTTYPVRVRLPKPVRLGPELPPQPPRLPTPFDDAPKVTRLALERAGVKDWDYFATTDASTVLDIDGIGILGWRWLKVELVKRGITLRYSERVDPDVWTCSVYFIRCGEFVKIGIADSVRNRLSGLQTGSPIPLDVVGVIRLRERDEAIQLEQQLHVRFIEDHARGEWFRYSDALKAFIAENATEAKAS